MNDVTALMSRALPVSELQLNDGCSKDVEGIKDSDPLGLGEIVGESKERVLGFIVGISDCNILGASDEIVLRSLFGAAEGVDDGVPVGIDDVAVGLTLCNTLGASDEVVLGFPFGAAEGVDGGVLFGVGNG